MSSRIRVLVASDQPLIREGMKALLKAYDDIEVIGEATNGKQSAEETCNLEPDVVLMDMTMKVMNAFQVTRRLSAEAPKTRVVILTDRDTRDSVAGAFLAGACGCIPNTATCADVASAIRAVYGGEVYLHLSLTKTLLQDYLALKKFEALEDPYERLTDRERNVLRLVAEGRTGPEIAQHLSIAVKTAVHYRTNIMRKMGIHNRAGLIKYAIRRGIVDLGPGE